MRDLVFHAFTKEAVSAGRTLAVLQARAAQGARVAPGLMHSAEQAAASGLASTPAFMRRTALGASESARMGQAAQRFGANPVTQAMQGRVGAAYERAMANPAAVRNMGARDVVGAADMGATGMSGVAKPYTQAHADSIFTPGAQMTSTPAASTPLAQWKSQQQGATRVGGKPLKPRMTPATVDSSQVQTQHGLVGGAVDRRFGAPEAPGAARSEQVTGISKRKPVIQDTAVSPNPFDRTTLAPAMTGVTRLG